MIPAAIRAAIPELAGRACRVEPLSGGLVNRSFVLSGDFGRWLLRVNGSAPGIDREREAQVLAALAGTGLGPEVIRNDPDTGFLLYRYIEGRPWSNERARSAEGQRRLGGWLRQLHDLRCEGAPLNPLAALRSYLAELPDAPEGRYANRARACFEALAACGFQTAPRVLCHGDVSARNIIAEDRGLRLIDWEYAGAAPAEHDLAMYLANQGLRIADANALLKAYAPSSPERFRRRLAVLVELARLLNETWRALPCR